MHVPIRPIKGRWPARFERQLSRFFWPDPTVVLDDDATSGDFSAAMAAFHVGQTIKITGANRHSAADSLLIENVALENASILDIGASDGSTSVDLIAALPTFETYTILDLFFYLQARRTRSHTLFYGSDDKLILICGRRAVAWPTLSTLVRAIYAPILRRGQRAEIASEPVLLLNPAARAVIARDSRVNYLVHDVFRKWDGPPADVIKVANLLRRLYFSDDAIRTALRALIESLQEGGHLLVVDNPRVAGITERAGLYRRERNRFVLVAQTTHRAEIHDLVVATNLGSTDDQAVAD